MDTSLEDKKSKKFSIGRMLNAIFKWGLKAAKNMFEWCKDQLLPWIGEKPKQAAIAAVATAMLVGMLMGHSLLINGLLLGLITAGAVGILFFKMKTSQSETVQDVYQTCMEYPLATDAGVTLLALLMFPASVTGLLGAATAGILASVFLMQDDPDTVTTTGRDMSQVPSTQFPTAA